MLSRIIASALVWLGLSIGAFAQAPQPVPALPDSARLTSYSISTSTCACSVGFQIYGSGTDVDEWIQVYVNGIAKLSTDPTFGWSLSSVTGSLGSIPRPITNAILTFNAAQTATVAIVGNERPRRLSQFSENRGVAARDLNQAVTDVIAVQRELWDKANRSIVGQPGDVLLPLPSVAARAGQTLCFDGLGNPMVCSIGAVVPTNLFSTANLWSALQTFSSGINGNNSPFNATFAGNAPYYFTCGNAPVSPTAVYNCAQFSMGTPILGSAQFGENTVTHQQALAGTIDCPVGSTFTGGCFGVAGYARNNSTVTPTVGLFGSSMCAIANCAEGDGVNVIVTNGAIPQATIGFDAPLLIGAQVNFQIAQKAGSINPTVGVVGFYTVGGGNATNNVGTAYAADRLSIQTGAKWLTGFQTYNGCCVTGISLGTLSGTQGSPPTNSGSQSIVFNGYASGSLKQATLVMDQFGNLLVSPQAGSAILINSGGGSVWLGGGSTVSGTVTYTGGGGLQIGAPTGGDKGANTINIGGSIWTNGTQGIASQTCTVNTASALTLIFTNGLLTGGTCNL